MLLTTSNHTSTTFTPRTSATIQTKDQHTPSRKTSTTHPQDQAGRPAAPQDPAERPAAPQDPAPQDPAERPAEHPPGLSRKISRAHPKTKRKDQEIAAKNKQNPSNVEIPSPRGSPGRSRVSRLTGVGGCSPDLNPALRLGATPGAEIGSPTARRNAGNASRKLTNIAAEAGPNPTSSPRQPHRNHARVGAMRVATPSQAAPLL